MCKCTVDIDGLYLICIVGADWGGSRNGEMEVGMGKQKMAENVAKCCSGKIHAKKVTYSINQNRCEVW